jgi:anti-sigma regulatory factor (Ser/Thr protein kinase)
VDQCIEVSAGHDGIVRLLAFTDEVERQLPLSPDQSYLLRLVVEEIATNIVKYGYGKGAPGVIRLCCSCDDKVLRVSMRDHGKPFDPREAPDPQMGDDVATRPVGGLGVYLVRAFADDLRYHHDAASGWNELVVVKG